MAIKITEDDTVRYVNENDVDRTMFPNLTGAMGDEQYDALNGRLVVVEGKISDLEECCGDVNNEITGLKNDLSELSSVYSAFVVETATGSIASFTDGADDVPVKDLTVAIEPVQSGSGDPSPTNIRPISGWTGANVYHSGEDTSDYDTLSISWETEAGTVYGGTLDVTTGVLTVDRAVVDLGTLEWNKDTNRASVFYANVATKAEAKTGAYIDENWLICDTYKYINKSVTTEQDKYVSDYPSYGGKIIFARDTTYTESAEFNTGVSGHYVAYKLATLQTYQLTPQEVSTVLGQNNIFVDCGSVTVQYRADTKLYIDKVVNA